jgi:tRNA-specific 2-thiouridylase
MVAMSGGVDSSVAAALMLEAGHRVTGVTLKLRTGPGGAAPTQGCCTAADALDARRVTDTLGIPHYAFDITEGFDEAVVQPFIEGYLAGRTPNPCVECNRHVKFSWLLSRALDLGADLLVTGHHVRLRDGRLFRAADRAKDQSYVLYMLTMPVISRCAFPVGDLRKSRVRELAEALGLRTASKPDSQDVCFLGREGLSEFMRREAPHRLSGGAIIDAEGRPLARHDGNVYTLGQRRGLGVATGRRMFVTELRPADGVVVVGDEADLWKRRLRVGGLSWVAGFPEGLVEVQVRSHGSTVPGRVRGADVDLEAPVRAPAPGQAAVFYRGDEMLGGGTILEAS